MTVTVASFKTMLPEFQLVDDARVTMYLANAATCMNARAWRGKYDLGQTYLCAHMLTMDTPSGGPTPGIGGPQVGGAVTEATVGQVTLGFAAAYAGAASGDLNAITDLASTKYGLSYSRLKRMILKTPVVI